MRQLELPSAASAATKLLEICEGCALSAFSFQQSASGREVYASVWFQLCHEQNFFTKSKEVTDNESIHVALGLRMTFRVAALLVTIAPSIAFRSRPDTKGSKQRREAT